MTEDMGNPEADIFRYCFPSGAPPQEGPLTTQQIRQPKRHRPEYGPQRSFHHGTSQLHGATSGQRASQAGQQALAAARGLHSADQAGQSLRDVPPGGSAQPAAGYDGHGQRMEPEEGQRGSIPGVTVANGVAGQRDQGRTSKAANRGGYRGGAQSPEAGPMVDGRRSLGVSEVVPQVQAADSGCIPPGPSARRGGQAAHHAPLPDEGRDRSDFQSRQHLRKLEEQGATSAAFKLEISLRGQKRRKFTKHSSDSSTTR